MARKWHPANREDFIKDYLSEKPLRDLARAYSVHEDVFARYGRALGLGRRGRPSRNLKRRVTTDDAAIVAAYVGGMSENAVAKAFGIQRNSVRLRLQEAGVHIRNSSEAETIKWKQMLPEQRKTRLSRVHDAARGVPVTFAQKVKTALTVQRKGLRTDPLEITLAAMLAERGVETIPQQAIGPYNCDLGAFPVAVEVFGGNWHFTGKHLARKPERFRYILNAGWHILCVWIARGFPLSAESADYVAAFVEQSRRDPTAIREYRMIRGAAQIVLSGRADDDHLAFVPSLAVRQDIARTDKGVAG